MPPYPRRLSQAAKRLVSQQVDIQAAQLEERLQNIHAQFRTAQLHYQASRTQFLAMQQECVWLQKIVHVKQQVIEELLPYYPHPLTPELIYAIELY
jgi:hypothetical protein